MDDRTTNKPDPKVLAEILGGWRGARPPAPEQSNNPYPIPPEARPDPVEGNVMDRLMEKLEAEYRLRQFMEMIASSGDRMA